MSPLFRVVLAEVPAARPGSAAACWPPPSRCRWRSASRRWAASSWRWPPRRTVYGTGFVLVLAIQAVLAVLLAVGSTRLPVRTTAQR